MDKHLSHRRRDATDRNGLDALRRAARIGLLCAVLVAGACSNDSSSDPAESESTDTTADDTGETTADDTSDTADPAANDGDAEYDPGLEPLVAQARDDLADRLDVETSDIVVTSAELRTWPNTANGCPQEGMVYADVLTDGAEFLFTVDGQEYRYTTGGEMVVPTFCEE